MLADGLPQPVEVGRYVAALRRNRLLILLIVVPITDTVLALSLVLPKTYTATARIVMRGTPFELADVETVRRELATTRVLLTTPSVYQRAAVHLPDESAQTLEGKVTAADCVAYPFVKYAKGVDPDDDELFHEILARYQPLGDDHPRVTAWIARMDQRPRA